MKNVKWGGCDSPSLSRLAAKHRVPIDCLPARAHVRSRNEPLSRSHLSRGARPGTHDYPPACQGQAHGWTPEAFSGTRSAASHCKDYATNHGSQAILFLNPICS